MSKKLDSSVQQVKDQGCLSSAGESPKKNEIEKAITDSLVVNPTKIGQDAVPLEAHMQAKQYHSDCLNDLRAYCSMMGEHEIKTLAIISGTNSFTADFVRKDAAINAYTMTLRKADDGALIQEAKDLSLELLAQMIEAQVGVSAMIFDAGEEMIMEPTEEAALEHEIVEHEMEEFGIEDNHDGSMIDEMEATLEAIEVEEKKKKLEISIEEDEICIKIRKSKENKMSFAEELAEKLAKSREEEAKAKPVEAENTKPETPVTDGSAGVDDSLLQAATEEEVAQDEMAEEAQEAEANEEMNEEMMDKQEEANIMEEGQKELGEETEGELEVEGQEGLEEGAEGMEAQEGEEGQLQYIKSSEFAGGQQHWYRDLKTGKIVEKETAPEGMEGSAQMSELSAKIAEISSKLDMVLGQETEMGDQGIEGNPQADMAAKEGMDETSQMGEGEEMDSEMVEGEEEAPEMTEEEFDKEVEEIGNEVHTEESNEKFMSEGKEEEEVKKSYSREEVAALVKSIKTKHPTLSNEKVVEVTKAVLAKACGAPMDKGFGDAGTPVATSMAQMPGMEKAEDKKKKKIEKGMNENSKENELTEPKFHGTKEEAMDQGDLKVKKQGAVDESENPKTKKKKIKKSRLARMWKVFGIEMPDTLDTPESLEKANKGIAILAEKIANQGKDQAEVNKVVNRAVIEKYDLLGKGKNFFGNFKDWQGGHYVYDGKSVESVEEHEEMLKSDTASRFAVKEYVRDNANSQLTNMKTTGLNEAIEKSMVVEDAKWDEFGEFKEDLRKSEPNEFQAGLVKDSDSRWDVSDYKGETEELYKEVKSDINAEVKKSIEKKEEAISFNNYKEYDEEKVKKSTSEKTDIELIEEEYKNRIWKNEE